MRTLYDGSNPRVMREMSGASRVMRTAEAWRNPHIPGLSLVLQQEVQITTEADRLAHDLAAIAVVHEAERATRESAELAPAQ